MSCGQKGTIKTLWYLDKKPIDEYSEVDMMGKKKQAMKRGGIMMMGGGMAGKKKQAMKRGGKVMKGKKKKVMKKKKGKKK